MTAGESPNAPSPPTGAQWQAFAARLKEAGEQLCRAITHTTAPDQALIIALLYARAYQSFQAAIVLAAKGLDGDARTIIRSCVEGAIAIAATMKDAAFVDQLVDDDLARRLTWARITLDNESLHEGLTPEQLANLREFVTREGTSQRQRKRINWEKIAGTTEARVLYHLHYRKMSWHTHVGIESLNNYAVLGANDEVIGVQCSATAIPAVETASIACDAFFWVSIFTAEFFGLADLQKHIRDMHREFAAMTGVPY